MNKFHVENQSTHSAIIGGVLIASLYATQPLAANLHQQIEEPMPVYAASGHLSTMTRAYTASFPELEAFKVFVAEFYGALLSRQKEMDPVFQDILEDNSWELYQRV